MLLKGRNFEAIFPPNQNRLISPSPQKVLKTKTQHEIGEGNWNSPSSAWTADIDRRSNRRSTAIDLSLSSRKGGLVPEAPLFPFFANFGRRKDWKRLETEEMETGKKKGNEEKTLLSFNGHRVVDVTSEKKLVCVTVCARAYVCVFVCAGAWCWCVWERERGREIIGKGIKEAQGRSKQRQECEECEE